MPEFAAKVTLLKTGAAWSLTLPLLTGCLSSSDNNVNDPAGPAPQTITIPFKAMVVSEPVACGQTYTGLGTSGTHVTIADFRLFVHDVKFVTDQGQEIPVTLNAEHPSQNSRVAQLDFRNTIGCETGADANPNFNDAITGSAVIDPRVSISDIRFTLGVPADLNHQNQADADEPLRNPGMATGMAWNWQGGYKFTGLDVWPVGGIVRPSNPEWSNTKWNVHLGSTNCPTTVSELQAGTSPEPCGHPNRKEVTLPLGALALDAFAVQLDYAELVASSNLGQDDGGQAGCMSGQGDPECEQILPKFGLAWGEAPAGSQSVFSLVKVR